MGYTDTSNFIKKETLAQMFSYEFCEISKKTFFCRTPLGDCFFFFCNLPEVDGFNTWRFAMIISLNGLKQKPSLISLHQLPQIFVRTNLSPWVYENSNQWSGKRILEWSDHLHQITWVGQIQTSAYHLQLNGRRNHQRYSLKKCFLKNFTKFIEKHLWTPLQNTSGRLLLK